MRLMQVSSHLLVGLAWAAPVPPARRRWGDRSDGVPPNYAKATVTRTNSSTAGTDELQRGHAPPRVSPGAGVNMDDWIRHAPELPAVCVRLAGHIVGVDEAEE